MEFEKMNNDDFAKFASAPISLPKMQVYNLQLKSWKDANQKYEWIKGNETPNLDDMILIVKLLGDSLTYLFGANWNQHGKTPTLKDFVQKSNLDTECPDLYKRFCDLDDFHKDVAKHFARSKILKAKNLTKPKLKNYMETARDIWIWHLKKSYNGNIPPEQLVEFGNI